MKESIEEVNERRKQELERVHSIRFRAWDNKERKMIPWIEIKSDKWMLWDIFNGHGHTVSVFMPFYVPMQYTGLKDKNGVEIYVNDVCEFENGDRFVIMIEDYLEIYVSWIGEPDCEDQSRDLYRIERSEIIGNIYENPKLLKESNE